MFSALVMMMSVGITSVSAAPVHKTYTVQSVDFVKDIYGDWERKGAIHEAGTKGESGAYFEGCKVETTSSFNISVPIKKISAKLGYEVKKSKISTVYASHAHDALFPGEQSAFYVRKHWKEYKIKYKVTERTSYSDGRGIQTKTKTYTKYETIKVPQEITHKDRKWFYTSKKSNKDLPSKIKANQCKNYVCE